MTRQDLHHLSAAYALNALTTEERQAFESHYPTCDICAQEVIDFRQTAAVLAEGAGAIPPTDLKSRVMVGVAQTQQAPVMVPDRVIDLADRRRQRTSWGSVLIGAAAAAIIAIIGTVAALRPGSPTDNIGELLAAPDAVVSTLDGTDGTIRIVWSPDRSELAIVGADLDNPGPDQTYELWTIGQGGNIAPAGLFQPDDNGRVQTVVAISAPEAINGFGVTIEPNGGSPQPTSDILFSGSV